MEESVSGFKTTGDWGRIVEHGERITRALREAGVEGQEFEDWNDWRPKSHEIIGEDIRKKTAQYASVSEGAGEKAGESPNDDLQTASDRLADSYESLEDNDTESAVEQWQDSVSYVARAADSAGRKALRSVEDTVFRRVMTQVAPYYFDNGLISANISRTRDSQDPFRFEVNINDDELKEEVREQLERFNDEIDRWHVDTEKQTENFEAVEGVEAPDTDDDSSSTTT
ncbi:MAG: DUF5828 family protein [Halobacteriales archaeon]